MRVQAPRGPILDSNGRILVTNQPVTSVELSPAGMPKVYAERAAEVRRIAHVARVSVRHVTRLIVAQGRRGDLLDPIVVRTEATGSMLTYLEERAAAFPGLTLARSYIRRYTYGSLAAQLLGYDGQIPQGDPRLGKDGYEPGDVIGLTGIERGLDMYLRGVPGLARVRVDSLGRPRSRPAADDAAAARADGAPDDQCATPARCSERSPVRHPARAQQGQVGGRRRRDRGAEPEGRLDPRAGLLAVVRPVGLQRTRDHSQAGRARAHVGHGIRPELSGARPRRRRHVSAGLDVQAAHRDRGPARST